MMTTLQIVLAIVGVTLIALIVIYNLLQERRFRKEAEKMFSHRRDDVMLGEAVRTEASRRRTETRIQLTGEAGQADEARDAIQAAEMPEPDLDLLRHTASADSSASLESLKRTTGPDDVRAPRVDNPPRTAASAGEVAPASRQDGLAMPAPVARSTHETGAARAPTTREPKAVPAQSAAVEPSTRTARDLPQPSAAPAVSQFSGLDWETEYIARIKFAAPMAASFGPLLATLRRVGKPVRAFGRRIDGAWEALAGHPRSTYDQVEVGLQLADRGGALSQDQLDAFCRALYEFAAEQGGAVSCPDKAEGLQKARELDLFCMEVDVLIGLNVVSADSRPFTSEAMHGLAEEAQLVLHADGSFHALDGFDHTLFTLANQGEESFPKDGRGLTTHGVTLLFDVPRVADGLTVFDRMTRLGFDLAWRLEGRLVDDNGRAVNEDSLKRDRARLAAFYQRMEARGIPAGGERALRLFV